jgi:hypothetical protein
MTFIAETNTDRLHSSVQRHVIYALIGLALGGIASLAGAQGGTPPEPSTSPTAAVTQDQGIRNIVLVHGAWADGSGWRGVYDNLVGDGFKVTIVQEPETSFQEEPYLRDPAEVAQGFNPPIRTVGGILLVRFGLRQWGATRLPISV